MDPGARGLGARAGHLIRLAHVLHCRRFPLTHPEMRATQNEPRPPLWFIGAALMAVGSVTAGWVADARRRLGRERRLHRALVDLLLNALGAGDAYTARHSRRVAALTDAIASTYGFQREQHARLRIASLLHDMGKIDDRFVTILHSSSALTAQQRQKIQQHPHESAHILEPLERVHPGITKIVESHHENWDGSGYPEGLRGDEIPLEARIISVADVFDALTEPRAYKDAKTVEEALAEIRRDCGRRFDAEVVSRLEQPEVLREWARIARSGRAVERAVGSGDGGSRPAADSATGAAYRSGPSGRTSRLGGTADPPRDRSSSR